MNLWDLLVEPLQYDFMVRAVLAATLVSLACAMLSCWLVLIGWSLMGDAVSHAVLPGVALAYLLGWPFAVGALLFGFIAVVLIGTISGTSRTKEDAAIGIVFSTLFALGLVIISVNPSQTDLFHILFGNVLGVSKSDLWQIATVSTLCVVALFIKRRDLALWAFDPEHTQAIGLSPARLRFFLLLLLALASVAALQVVGVILVVAMMIIPGATAHLLTDRFNRMLLIAPVFAILCSVLGIYVSYWLDNSPGGMIVLIQGIAYAFVYVFSPRHGVLSQKWVRPTA